jgi:hypothetical protein
MQTAAGDSRPVLAARLLILRVLRRLLNKRRNLFGGRLLDRVACALDLDRVAVGARGIEPFQVGIDDLDPGAGTRSEPDLLLRRARQRQTKLAAWDGPVAQAPLFRPRTPLRRGGPRFSASSGPRHRARRRGRDLRVLTTAASAAENAEHPALTGRSADQGG